MAKISPPQKASTGKSLREFTELVARQLAQGARPQDVIDQLVERGWPEASARQFVASVSQRSSTILENSLQRRSHRRRCWLGVLRSLLLILLGLVIMGIGVALGDIYLGLFQFTAGVLLCVFETIDLLSGLTDWARHR